MYNQVNKIDGVWNYYKVIHSLVNNIMASNIIKIHLSPYPQH